MATLENGDPANNVSSFAGNSKKAGRLDETLKSEKLVREKEEKKDYYGSSAVATLLINRRKN